MSFEYQLMFVLFAAAIIWIFHEAVLVALFHIVTMFLYPMAFICGFIWGILKSIWRLVRGI